MAAKSPATLAVRLLLHGNEEIAFGREDRRYSSSLKLVSDVFSDVQGGLSNGSWLQQMQRNA